MTADHHDRKEAAALASIGASVAITAAKLGAGLVSGSLALLSEAGHAAVDTAATVLTWLAVRAGGKPADDTHHYGHGKLESLAALVETGLLFALAAYVVVEAIHRLLTHQQHVEAKPIAFAVLIFSIIVDVVRWRSLSRIAEETHSDALAADALHFSSDFVASTLVLIGLIFTAFGYPQADTLAAFGVALFIAVAGYRLGRRTIDTLLDAAPEGLAEKMRAAVEATPGVVRIDFLRLRPSGAQVLGELGVAVARTAPVERVARITDRVKAALREIEPNADLTLTTTPVALDEESALERIHLVALRQRVSVHHVTVQDVSGRLSVSLDLELDGRLTLANAHERASRLEAGVREELGEDVEVETHIEPLETRELSGRDATAQETQAIAAALSAAAAGSIACDVHHVRVRISAAGLIVNYHCRINPDATVEAAHDAVDTLDRRLRAQRPDVVRIVGHAEPLKSLTTV
ncbi:MAG: cation diffusion facilitator family transporter [Hyphomicrobiales bacterium]|nr:cation diffusion facilitator family transporter [Hyphomicrobiales bacterium]